jgi:hypothetical protein
VVKAQLRGKHHSKKPIMPKPGPPEPCPQPAKTPCPYCGPRILNHPSPTARALVTGVSIAGHSIAVEPPVEITNLHIEINGKVSPLIQTRDMDKIRAMNGQPFRNTNDAIRYLKCGKCGATMPESVATAHLVECQPGGAVCGRCKKSFPPTELVAHMRRCESIVSASSVATPE